MVDNLEVRNICAESGILNAEWYLKTYPEVLLRNIDPLDDYILYGFSEGRNPSPLFSNEYYVLNNPDVPEGVNPLYHFCTKGWKEFRNPSEVFNILWYIIKNFDGKIPDINPLSHFLSVGSALELSISLEEGRGLSVAEKTSFNIKSIDIFNGLSLTATLAGTLSKSAAELNQYDLADMFATRACELDPENCSLQMQLGRILVKRSGWLRLLQTMTKAQELEPSCAEAYLLSGLASHKLERFGEAIQFYQKSMLIDKNLSGEWFYRLGECEEELGNLAGALVAFEIAVERSEGLPSDWGVAGLHERMGSWRRAAKAYSKRIDEGAGTSSIYIRYGLMLDMCYEWDRAEIAYRNAILLDALNAETWYRLGEVLERKGDFEEAAVAYEKACELNIICVLDWRYRQGCVLLQLGKSEQAVEAFLMAWKCFDIESMTYLSTNVLERSIFENRQDAQLHSDLGHAYEGQGRIEEAVEAFAEAVSRRNDYLADDYYHWGRLLAHMGRFEDAAKVLINIREYRKVFSLSKKENSFFDVKRCYSEFLDNLEIRGDVVLYESYHGASVSCNPYAIFCKLLVRADFFRFVHVWVLKKLEDAPRKYRNLKNVVFVRYGSKLYLKYLASAKWLINNNTFPPYFIRRDGQLYLNTWHGTPIKSLGVDIPGFSFDHKNVVRNILQSTHIIYPNEHTFKAFFNGYQGDQLYTGKLALTGYPRIDLMLNCGESRKYEIRSSLGIDDGRPVLLYAPTWRGGDPEQYVNRIVEDINILSKQNINLVVSAHHLLRKALEEKNLPILILGKDIDTTEFLSVVDVLVTDYSSILFDYLPLRKPIILYVYDLEQYESERGLYFDICDLPAVICKSIVSLLAQLKNVLDKVDLPALHESSLLKYCPKEDGCSTERVVDFFFFDKCLDSNSSIFNKKKKILFYAGAFIPNGVTAAFLRLISLLPADRYSITLALDPWSLESYPQRMQRISELPEHVNILGRISFPVASEEDTYLNNWFQACKGDVPSYVKERLIKHYQREYRRLYGNANFDAVVDFCGYTFFWSSLFGLGRSVETQAAIWLHADMEAEIKTRFPYLKNILALSDSFDRLVSVSEGSYKVNSQMLGADYGIPNYKMCYVRNSIDPAWLRRKSQESLSQDIINWADGSFLIGSVGRLSREKAQDRVIRAFAQISNEYPSAKLVVAGQGPELGALNELVNGLGICDRVRLLGYIENPFPLFKRLDLFVLPSNYEGQGLVVLEALTLDCNVISTDISGPREILEAVGGVLVEPSVEGVQRGIEAFLKGEIKKLKFDVDAYVKTAISDFTLVINSMIHAGEAK